MPSEAHDLSPEDLLERQVTQAYLEQDYAQVQDMLKQKNFPNAVKDTVLTTALRDGNLPLVKFVIDEANVELTDTRALMLVFLACQKQKLDIVLYLSEKTAQLGLERSDAYELVFSRFPQDKHEQAADELLARASDKQDALNKMLYAAAASKAFGVIPHLLDRGADPNAHGGTDIYLLLTAYDRDFFDDRAKYLGVMQKYLDKFEDKAVLDVALTVACFKIPDGTQYPEVIRMLLDKEADPFSGHGEAKRYLTNLFGQLRRDGDVRAWDGVFGAAQAKDIALHRHQFDVLFGPGFKTQDLRQLATPDGDTGFMLAAKARVLDQVVAAAIREGTAPLTAQDLLQKNARNQSLLSLAIDRDDTGLLLDPAYWSKAAPGILRTVAESLAPEQKPFVDLARLTSALDQFTLRQQASKFRLKPS
jgi:hypothetical protein